jgi:hypothetical protein
MKKIFTVNSLILLLAISLLSLSNVYSQTAVPSATFNGCLTTAMINWDNTQLGGGESFVIFVSPAPITVGTPTSNISTYTANTALGSGTAYQNDASAHCVYKGGGSSVGITGLTAGTTYYVLLFDAKNASYSAALTISGSTITTPGDVTALAAATGNGQSSVSWADPSTCFDEILIVASTASITGTPSGDGTGYTNGNKAFTTGTILTGSEYVVYRGGSGNSPQIITGLTNGITYFFKVWSRKTTTWSSGVQTSVTLPPAAVTGAAFNATCIDAGNASWTVPTAVYNIVVFAKQGSAITVGSPSANTSTYTANAAFGSGTAYENDASAFCVYKGNSTNVNVTGLTPGATYHFAAFNVNGTNYSSVTAFNNSTPSTPNNATGFTPSAGNAQVGLSWTSPTGCFDEVMVVASQSGAVGATPSGNGSTYTPVSATFGSGYAIVASTEYVVYKGTGTSVTVIGLTNCTQADFKIFTRKGTVWSSGATTSSTPIAPITISSLSPLNGASNVATNTKLTLNFNQTVTISATAGTAAETSIVITENGSAFQTITRGSGNISIAGNVVTVTINALNLNKTYEVVVGAKVFSACGSDFAGITAGNWDFTSSPGISITAPLVTLCQNVYGSLGSIILNETAVNNIQGTASTTKNLILKFDASGFAFKAGNAGVSISTPNGDDITSATPASISFSAASINFTFPAGSAIDGLDQISINGLQVISDGSNPTGNIVVDPASTLTIQGLTTGTTILGTVNSGSTPPVAPTAPTITGGVYNFCQGTNISAISASATGSNLKWYSDIALTTLVFSGKPANLQTDLGINSAVAGAHQFYVTQTSTCESSSLTFPLITVYPKPSADAGHSSVSGTKACSGTAITLGGSPTVTTPSTPPYTYAWSELTGNYASGGGGAIAATSNPQVIINNTSGATKVYNFQIVVTDGNNCTATDTTKFDVYTQTNLFLTQPSTTTFTTTTPPQLLQVNISATNPVFTGVGVIQTSPTTYKFDPTQAYDPNKALPQTFDISFSGTDPNGCLANNGGAPIATMTLSNSTFQYIPTTNQYCSSEAPYSANPTGSGNLGNTATAIDLTLSASTVTTMASYASSWNSTYRFYYTYTIPNWNGTPSFTYYQYDLVYYNGEVYRANSTFSNAAIPLPPTVDARWTSGAFTTDFNASKIVRNYYEGYYGGNSGAPTILQNGGINYMFTNPNYVNCPSCSYLYPATYIEFKFPQDIFSYLQQYDPINYGYYYADQSYPDGLGGTVKYPGAIVHYQGRVFKCLAYNDVSAPQYPIPGATTAYWSDITNVGFDLGYIFYKPTGTNAFGNTGQSGFAYYGQFVTVNRNPPISFAGLTDGQEICQADIAGAGVPYNLISSYQTGGISNAGTFTVSFNNGSTWLSDGASGGAIQNTGINTGQATFDSNIGFTKASTAAAFNNWNNGTYNLHDNVIYAGLLYTSLVSNNTNHQPDVSPTYWKANTISVQIKLAYDPGSKGSDGVTPCSGVSIINIFIHKTPAIAFNSISTQTYCNYDALVAFSTVQNSGVVLSGFGVTDLGNGNGSLDPASAFNLAGGGATAQTINLTAVITDVYGCQNSTINNAISVNPPVPSSYAINTPSTNYNVTKATGNQVIALCYTENATTLTGSQTTSWFDVIYQGTTNPYTYATGFFTSPSVKSFNNNLSFLPKTFFDDAVSKGANPLNTISFLIVFHSYDNIYCSNVISTVTFVVSPQLQVDISGISDGQVFCANGSAGTNNNSNLISLGLTPYQQGLATFSINGINQTLSSNSVQYTFANTSTVQDVTFSYNVSSGGGNACQNPVTKIIHILPSPVASYTVTPHCDGDVISFSGSDGSGNSASNSSLSPSYTWTFNDVPVTVVNAQSTTYKFSTIGNYAVHLDIVYAVDPTYNKACSSNNDKITLGNTCGPPNCADETQVVGPIPTVDFTFSNVCQGDATNFVSSQTNGVTDYNWDFGDAASTGFGVGINNISSTANTTGTYQNPVHTYGPATYTVTVTGRTSAASGACLGSKTRVVSILKSLSANPLGFYDMASLNGGDGFWVAEDRGGVSTWNFGPATPGTVIANTKNAWNNISYNVSDESYMNSPCLNLSAYSKPAINFQYFIDTRQQQDGAVLQYSTDVVGGVQQWVTLGNPQKSGLNWYTSQGISGKPGDPFNANFYGWSRQGDTTWVDARHSLDEILNRGKVRFRIAFASDGGSTNSLRGLAFTNLTIVERNRVSLIENFTNNNLSSSSSNNSAFQSLASLSNEVVKIEYHTALPQPDASNLLNSADQNARAAYYGITNSSSLLPDGFLDGISGGNFTSASWPTDITLRSLKASPLNITINPSGTKVNVDITPVQPVNSGRLQVYVALIEKSVGSDQFVLRKFYPNASGTPLALPLSPSTITIDPWVIGTNEIVDINQIALVAFVQDLDTKEVIQAVYLPNPSVLPAVVTSVEPLTESSIRVYPNPSDKEFIVQLPEPVKQSTSISLVDQFGRTLNAGEFQEGELKKTVSTQGLSDGIYILQVGDQGQAARKKVMVLHK